MLLCWQLIFKLQNGLTLTTLQALRLPPDSNLKILSSQCDISNYISFHDEFLRETCQLVYYFRLSLSLVQFFLLACFFVGVSNSSYYQCIVHTRFFRFSNTVLKVTFPLWMLICWYFRYAVIAYDIAKNAVLNDTAQQPAEVKRESEEMDSDDVEKPEKEVCHCWSELIFYDLCLVGVFQSF